MYETTYFLWGLLSIASIAHFIFPFLLGLLILKKNWIYGIFILIFFEVIENTYFYSKPFILFGIGILSPEPFVNIVADLVIGSLGLYLGYLFYRRRKR